MKKENENNPLYCVPNGHREVIVWTVTPHSLFVHTLQLGIKTSKTNCLQSDKKRKVKRKSDVSSLIRRCFDGERVSTLKDHDDLLQPCGMKGLRRSEKTKRWSSFHPESFNRVQRSPLYFPDISMFLFLKTLQTPLHIFPLQKHGSPPLRNRRSCWCPRGLCILV
ncbi:hypothetical protein ILYODFUR_025739 [Ilyodon furcidens]|uniref:Uncharacterized protein n=1 Tax=Ilyodon furcidens TaxID=33524 RepID=A0ABV0TLY6_9TELE